MTNQKKQRLNPFVWLFKQNPQYALAFFIPFGILLLAYICFGVYPVGNRSVLSLDLNGQYVYYFDYMYDVLAGKESLFYSWSRSLSGEFMGIIGYYLASPFNFLVWLFPRAHITEGLLVMLVTKTGAIGLCMSVYLSRGRGLSKGTTVIFSMMYALCSYTIVQTMNPMWLDGVMALPLVIYGIESLIRHGRFRMLILSLIYSFVTCFYIGYMIGIFSAIYFLFYFFASDSAGKLKTGAVTARIGLFFISSVISVMCSCFMILPVYNSLSLGKFEFSVPDYSVRSNFDLISLFGKLLPNSYDTVRMDGLPFLYCGILSVIMLICFFIGGSGKKSGNDEIKSISARKRIAGAVLLIFMTACMYVTPVDMLWHGGQLPNWLPYRYSFILSFLIAGWGAEAFDRLSDYPKKLIGGVAAGFFAVMVYLEGTDTFMSELGKEGREVLDGITVVLPAVLVLLIIAAMLVQWRDRIGKKRAVTVTLGIVIGCELFYNTLMGIVKQDIDIVYSTRDSYVNIIEPTREVVRELVEKELAADPNAIFRIEKNYFRTVNDPLALNMYGLSHSSSTLNTRPIELLEKLGLTSRSHYTRYSGATPLIDDLFGVKYILSVENNDTGKLKTKDDIIVEENTDAMPVAYIVDAGFADFKLDGYSADKLNVFSLQNRIVSAMLGEPANDYIKIIEDVELETENVKYGTASGGHTSYKVETSGKNAQLKYTLTAENDGEIFLWMPTDYERKLNIWVNNTVVVNQEIEVDGDTVNSQTEANVDVWKGNMYETDNYCVKSLGEFAKGEEFSVTMTLTKDDLYFKDVFFAYVDSDLYLPAIERLHAMNVATKVEKLSSTHLKISVNAAEERLLFTTIPAEPGWSVTVDGTQAEYVEICGDTDDSGALIGVKVPSGSHIIEMKFTTGFYPFALYITGGGIVLLLLMFIFSHRLNKARKVIEQENDENEGYFEESGENGESAEGSEKSDWIAEDISAEEVSAEDVSAEDIVTEDVVTEEVSDEQSINEEILNDDVAFEDNISSYNDVDDDEDFSDLMFTENISAEDISAEEGFEESGYINENHEDEEENNDNGNEEPYAEREQSEYDIETVDKNIGLILGELDEINQMDMPDSGERAGTEYAGSADDLFPDEEIENMDAD